MTSVTAWSRSATGTLAGGPAASEIHGQPAVWLAYIRDGKIARWRTYTNVGEGLEAAGLSSTTSSSPPASGRQGTRNRSRVLPAASIALPRNRVLHPDAQAVVEDAPPRGPLRPALGDEPVQARAPPPVTT